VRSLVPAGAPERDLCECRAEHRFLLHVAICIVALTILRVHRGTDHSNDANNVEGSLAKMAAHCARMYPSGVAVRDSVGCPTCAGTRSKIRQAPCQACQMQRDKASLAHLTDIACVILSLERKACLEPPCEESLVPASVTCRHCKQGRNAHRGTARGPCAPYTPPPRCSTSVNWLHVRALYAA
jgi:hypothetical protein